jgi:hypothetical protein
MHFTELNLIQPILRAIEEEGYTTPTPIQQQAIPHVLKGTDVLGCAQTGTGKTAAFSIPILQQLADQSFQGKRKIRTLILTPTREFSVLRATFETETHRHFWWGKSKSAGEFPACRSGYPCSYTWSITGSHDARLYFFIGSTDLCPG